MAEAADRDRGDAEIVYVPRERHACDLPAANGTDPKVRPGTIVRCAVCGAHHELVGAGFEKGQRSTVLVPARWHRLGWTEVLVHQWFGRIPTPERTEGPIA